MLNPRGGIECDARGDRQQDESGRDLTLGARDRLERRVRLHQAERADPARLVTDDYLSGSYARIDVIYPKFVSTLTQQPTLGQILPIVASEDTAGIPGNQFIFEPSPSAVLEQLLPRYVATRLFQAVLEAKASEESSRMVAMKNATENAEELIEDLTLSYNKVRQANITREMIEIASGAQAR